MSYNTTVAIFDVRDPAMVTRKAAFTFALHQDEVPLFITSCVCMRVCVFVCYVFSSMPGSTWGFWVQYLQGCTRAALCPHDAHITHCVHQVNEVEIASFDGRAHMAAADDNGEVFD